MSELPAELRHKIEAFLLAKPNARPLLDKMQAKHAQATTPEARAKVEKQLSFLVSPPRHTWIFGVLILLPIVGIIAAVAVTDQQQQDAVAAGVRTTAQVLRMDEGSCTFGEKGSDCLRLSLRIHPPGAAPYEAALEGKIKHRFSSRVQPGSWLTVSVAKDDPSRVMFDEDAMATAAPAPIVSAPPRASP